MPHYHQKDVFDYIAAIVPLLAVLVAIGVGWVQFRIQKKQLQQDVFEKRFVVYSATRTLLVDLLRPEGPSDADVLSRFIEETAHCEFLFGKDVVDLRERIIKTASRELGIRAVIGGVGNDDFQEYRVCVEELLSDADPSPSSDETTFTKQLETIQEQVNGVFHRYLQLHNDRNWLVRFIDRLNQWVDGREDVLAAGRASEQS